MEKLKKVVIKKPGGYEKLKLEEFNEIPVPRENEVLIEIKAAGLNYADCVVRMGLYESAKKYEGYPITPGFEVAGVVQKVGEKVKNYREGDEVIGLTRFNGYSSHLCLPQKQVFRKPRGLDFVQAAGFPVVFLTAFYGLFELANPKPGQKVLIHSAAGGVGTALVQLSSMIPCEITGVVGSDSKLGYLEKIGVENCVSKEESDYWKQLQKISPEGFDIIFDANGPSTLKQSYDHLCPGGKLVIYGFHSMLPKQGGKPKWGKIVKDYLKLPKFNPLDLTTDNKSLLAFNLSFLFHKSSLLNESMESILEYLMVGSIHPLAVNAMPIEKVAEAQKMIESGTTTGKLVLTF